MVRPRPRRRRLRRAVTGMSRPILFAATVALAAGLIAPVPARAKALHDIVWYMGHDRARAATLDLCRGDHSFALDPDCANAESAENRLWAERASKGAGGSPRGRLPRSPRDILASPTYWAENGLARIGALAACRTPGTEYRPEQCAAARRGDAMARTALDPGASGGR